MKVHLASVQNVQKYIQDILRESPEKMDKMYVLESYFGLPKTEAFASLIKYFGSFLLDSGAFSFLNSFKGKIDWDRYIEDYADYINKNDIKHFFELDIDSIVGLDRVERFRERLESLTGKKPIPVWHKNRGKGGFLKMCQEYPYVAIGGIVIKEIPLKEYERMFPWFIKTAHDFGCKIHGLGYTNIEGLHKYRFDSVDSTSWKGGARGGYLHIFDPCTKKFIQRRNPDKGKYRLIPKRRIVTILTSG